MESSGVFASRREADDVSGTDGESLVAVTREGARLDVRINRPDKRNALSRPTLAALKEAFERHAADTGIKVAVLTGAGDKSFAAGGDLNDLASIRTIPEAADMSRQARGALQAIRDFPVPVIAALNGDALGGGAELAVACDMRIAATHARIGFVQGRLAITTAWGGGIDLASLVGPSRALSLLCRTDLLAAEEAQRVGLVDDVARSGETLDDAVTRFAKPIMSQVRHALVAFKALATAHRQGASRTELEQIETARFAEAWCHDDHWAAADAVLTRRER